jgi:tetratricopeptide (TPR) repeat protein
METAIAQLQRRAIEFATSGNFGPDSLAANLELARLAPDNEGAWTRLSRCYMEGGQLDEATGALESVLAVNPRNSIAHSLKIEVNRRRVSLLPVEPKVKPSRVRAPKRVRSETSEIAAHP